MTNETPTLNWVPVAELDELWEGEMMEVTVDEQPVLLVHCPGGQLAAYQGTCPHQQRPLSTASFDGATITCAAHRWQFQAATGKGINPASCQLYTYQVRLEEGQIFIGVPADGGRRYNRCTA